MTKERQTFYQEHPFIKKALIFVGILIAIGISIDIINDVLSFD